jgi:sec-independent protein translocase protein TatA
MGAISPMHLVLVLAIAVLLFGPGKLPETGAAIGKAIRGFRDAADGKPDAAAATDARTSPPQAGPPAA